MPYEIIGDTIHAYERWLFVFRKWSNPLKVEKLNDFVPLDLYGIFSIINFSPMFKGEPTKDDLEKVFMYYNSENAIGKYSLSVADAIIPITTSVRIDTSYGYPIIEEFLLSADFWKDNEAVGYLIREIGYEKVKFFISNPHIRGKLEGFKNFLRMCFINKESIYGKMNSIFTRLITKASDYPKLLTLLTLLTGFTFVLALNTTHINFDYIETIPKVVPSGFPAWGDDLAIIINGYYSYPYGFLAPVIHMLIPQSYYYENMDNDISIALKILKTEIFPELKIAIF